MIKSLISHCLHSNDAELWIVEVYHSDYLLIMARAFGLDKIDHK